MDGLNFLFVFGLDSAMEDGYIDIISKLPLEIAVMILRKLDGSTLLNVQKVSKKWYNICRSDRKIRQKIHQHEERLKLRVNEMIFGRLGIVDNVPRYESISTAFRSKNSCLNSNMKRTAIEVSSRNSMIRTQSRPINRPMTTVNRPDVPSIILETSGNSKIETSRKRKRNESSCIGAEQRKRLRRL